MSFLKKLAVMAGVGAVAVAATSATTLGKRARAALREDLDTARRRDPAVRSDFVTAVSYPGLHAVWAYRGLHELNKVPGGEVPARILSQAVRTLTGVEIHPAAKIGRRFFIDHADGIVVGATAEIGDDVMLYQQVTLGGTSMEQTKRHPTLGNNVLVGAGAKILGPITVGDGASVGANAVVVKDVPADHVAVGVPAKNRAPKGVDTPQNHLLEDPAIWI
ncbi:serine O-acetyltransferase [Brevibacterium sp. ACRRH]|uniref:serine O-acetyltransferase n=1 Tax=Brevibacterium sp. ACRRH TaxID=2918183 RepID=UPI001EF57E73|nr:serine O-acetyltransferase [Brevibacterium sp. ACRRH]MCG7298835.1 serine O-acetyltransferase [Brevibacterium sp. ACRRH]